MSDPAAPTGPTTRSRAWVGPTIAVLTVGWIGFAITSFCAAVAFNFSMSGEPLPGNHDRSQWWLLAFSLTLGGGPVGLAALAASTRRSKAFVVFAVLALGLLLPSLYGAGRIWRDLHPHPAPDEPSTSHCVERSGGGTRCPGG